jgi:glycosyltransferase involved in cell wall biosynthesis
MDNKKIFILSTSANSGRGGISTSVSNLLAILEKNNKPHEHLPTHYPGASKISNIVSFLKVLGKLSITSTQDAIFHLHVGPKGSLLRKTIICALLKFKKGTIFTHYHSPIFLNYLQEKGFWGNLLGQISKLSSKNLALNDYWKNIFESALNKEFMTLPNPMSPSLELQPSPPTSSAYIRVSCAARLVKEKNIQEVIKLSEINKEIHLKIIGGGPYESQLKSLAESSSASERIQFTGWLNNKSAKEEIGHSDIFILPSQYDSFGMVYIEALAEGVPVIAPKLPPVMDTLKDLKGVSHGDTAEEINTLIGVSLSHTRSEIKESLESKFGEEQYLKRLQSIINQ